MLIKSQIIINLASIKKRFTNLKESKRWKYVAYKVMFKSLAHLNGDTGYLTVKLFLMAATNVDLIFILT